MSLDITFSQQKKIICPNCGEIVGHIDVQSVDTGGRAWYPFLESIGYYVDYDKRTEENDWYGKDMVLTAEQLEELYRFAQQHDLYGSVGLPSLIASARYENDDVVVNADW